MAELENKDSVVINDEEVYNKKTIPTVPPKKDNGIDLTNSLYSNIIEAGLSSHIDMSSLSSLNTRAEDRNQMYNMYDAMCEDGTIGAVVETYAEDATETNDNGHIVWVTSSDTRIAEFVEYLLDTLNVDKHIFKWVYSLCKYGDLYLRLFRESEYNDLLFYDKKPKTLNEDVKVNVYSKNDKFAHYMEMVNNPAEMFELTKFGKTIGYIKAPVNNTLVKQDNTMYNTFTYKFKKDDLEIYPATEFVHASLEDNVGRDDEMVSIFITEDDYNNGTNENSYKVRKGQSLLSGVFKTWRELSLLENSVLLNRVTKSSIVRLINVEVGDMPKENVRSTLLGIKQMLEQKTVIDKNNSMSEYTNPGPIENNLYIPTCDGKGSITTSQIGGDVDVKSLADLDYYMNKMYSQLKVPKQYFCLRGNTPILLLDGETTTIEYMFKHKQDYLNKGILSCDPSGKVVPTTIKNIMLTKPSASFLRIHLDNGKYIDVTPEHRMMLRDGTFVEAQELNINDSLMPYYDKIKNGRRYVLDNESGKWKLQYRIVAESVYDNDELYNKQVHHINHNKLDDDFNNLIPLDGSEHIREHLNELHKANKDNGKIRRLERIPHGNTGKFSVTNGVVNMWLNEGDAIPDGFYLGQTCNYTEESKRKIGEATSAANKGKSTWLSGKTKETDSRVAKLVTNSSKTRALRKLEGKYKQQYKNQSDFCKRTESWRYMHDGHMKTIPTNRLRKEHYVRCVYCGSIHKIKCNDDWYTEYLNMDKLWYCSKECSKFDGRGKLSRSYKLYKECNSDIDTYDLCRKNNGCHRPDFYFLAETLSTKLPIMESYVPECNHKVIAIERLDVTEPAYDIEVVSENHTFALPCGIFVHNCQTDDSTGFNGGTSLSIISSRYAKTIKRIQNTIVQALTDAINLMLLDKGLDSYVNNFQLHMLPPTTQEEIDRRDNLSSKVQLTSDIMNMLNDIEDTSIKLKILKSLLTQVLDDSEVTDLINEQIDILEQEQKEAVEQETEPKDIEDNSLNDLSDTDNMTEINDIKEPTEESDLVLPTGEELGIDLSELE